MPVIKTIPISRGPWPAYILTTPFDFFAARENIEALVLSTGSDVKGGESILQSDMQDSFPLKVPFTQPGAAEEVQAVQKNTSFFFVCSVYLQTRSLLVLLYKPACQHCCSAWKTLESA